MVRQRVRAVTVARAQGQNLLNAGVKMLGRIAANQLVKSVLVHAQFLEGVITWIALTTAINLARPLMKLSTSKNGQLLEVSINYIIYTLSSP